MNHRFMMCGALLAVLCLPACGQTGALYLPDQTPVRKPLPYSQTHSQPAAAPQQAKPDTAPATTSGTTAPAANAKKENP